MVVNASSPDPRRRSTSARSIAPSRAAVTTGPGSVATTATSKSATDASAAASAPANNS